MKQVYACQVKRGKCTEWCFIDHNTGYPELYASKEMLEQYAESIFADLREKQKKAIALEKRMDELLSKLDSLSKEEEEELDNIDETFIIDYKDIPTSYKIISIPIINNPLITNK